MIPQAKQDVLNVLNDAIYSIANNKYADLHAISDHILHVMAIYQNPDTIDIAIAVYSLDKILETEKYLAYPKINIFLKEVTFELKDAKIALDEGDLERYRHNVYNLLASIQGLTKKIKFYTEDILHFARIKKGSKLYEHGLSLGRAAEAAGVTKWEIMETSGETAVHEKYVEPVIIDKERLKFIMKIFKVK